MAAEELYMIQPAFTTGEVAPEVANRVDLEKYQSALLTAENAYIRPYGAVYKRGGTVYCGQAKYADKRCILCQFGYVYLLEIGDQYIRVWKNDAYTGIEIPSPYLESELSRLRVCQSADVMYIASGTHPVMTLSRYSDTDWRLEEFVMDHPYFDSALMGNVEQSATGYSQTTPGTYTWVCGLTGDYEVEVAAGGGGSSGTDQRQYTNKRDMGSGGRGGYVKKTVTCTKDQSYTIVVGAGGAAGGVRGSGGNGGNSSAMGMTAQGGSAGRIEQYEYESGGENPGTETAYRAVNGTSYGQGGAGGAGATDITYDRAGNPGKPGWVTIRYTGYTLVHASKTEGRDAVITANKPIFTSDMAGGYIKLSHAMPSRTVSTSGSQTSSPVLAGSSWKIITHGTWTGTITVQSSEDNANWKEYRKYNSSDDFNASESGTVDTPTWLRIVATAGKADLTALPYTHEGIARITSVTSATEVKADIVESFGTTDTTMDYTLSSWSAHFGYPQCVAFFQDRLCFAATKAQPYMVWMSRTGDYPNFSVEKASGTVTDDSAVALAFISRKQQTIQHLVPAADLMVLTDGNEWIVSGGETVTPTKGTPKAQTSRGCTGTTPIIVGSRIIYVQRRGKTVRDMGYSFESDNYDGMDLTLLAAHLTRKTSITDAAYMQDPDSMVYFVLANGEIACLSYVQDQKVYAWSHLTTEGSFEAVCDIEGDDRDMVYTVVKRHIGGKDLRFIERFSAMAETDNPDDYNMLDCSSAVTGAKSTGSLPYLAGTTVGVLADGRYYKNIYVDEEGNFTIPAMAKTMRVGLPYSMKVQVPRVEMNTSQGTVQGRRKKVTGVTLRIVQSLGGRAGIEETNTDEIKYDELSAQTVSLYSGDKEVTMPNPGFELTGGVYLQTDEPYPFTLAAIVRKVVISG